LPPAIGDLQEAARSEGVAAATTVQPPADPSVYWPGRPFVQKVHRDNGIDPSYTPMELPESSRFEANFALPKPCPSVDVPELVCEVLCNMFLPDKFIKELVSRTHGCRIQRAVLYSDGG